MVELVAARYPWDYFLEKQIDDRGFEDEESRQRFARNRREHIRPFREDNWPQIQRELKKHHGYVVAPDEEPHWVDAAGTAMYWMEDVGSTVVTDADGVSRLQEHNNGFRPIEGPANNASQIATRLKKGLRLRPDVPHQESEAGREENKERVVELTDDDTAQYWCYRHGINHYGFKTWSAYLSHCRRSMEMIEHDAPDDVVEVRLKFPYYCIPCDKGFSNQTLAERHLFDEQQGPAKFLHPSTEQLEVHMPVVSRQPMKAAEKTGIDSLKVGELEELAAERGVDVPTGAKKADLIKLLS